MPINNPPLDSLLESTNLVRAMLWNEIIAETKLQENLKKQLNNKITQTCNHFEQKIMQLEEKIAQLKPNQHNQKEKLEREKSQLQLQHTSQMSELHREIRKNNEPTLKAKKLHTFLTKLEDCTKSISTQSQDQDFSSFKNLKTMHESFSKEFPQSRPNSSRLSFFKPTSSPLQMINRELEKIVKTIDDPLQNNTHTKSSNRR